VFLFLEEGGLEGDTPLLDDSAGELRGDPGGGGRVNPKLLDGQQQILGAGQVASTEGGRDHPPVDDSIGPSSDTGLDVGLVTAVDGDTAGDGIPANLTHHVLDLPPALAQRTHTADQSEAIHEDPVAEELEILLCIVPVVLSGPLVLLAHVLAPRLLRRPLALLLLRVRIVCRHSERL